MHPTHDDSTSRSFGILRQASAPHHGTVTLFGALHFGSDVMYPLPQRLLEAQQQADAFAFETNLATLATIEFNEAMRCLGQQAPGQLLHQSLQAETWQKLAAHARALGFSPEYIDVCQPWYAASMLTSAALRNTGLNSQLGIDTVIFNQAAANGHTIICLEQPEQQLQLLADINQRSDEDFITQTLAELDDMPRFTQNMLDLWLEQREEELAELVSDGFADNSPLQQRMLLERNQRWFDILDRHAAQGHNILAVVGAGHLLGSDSIMTCFRHAGYTVHA